MREQRVVLKDRADVALVGLQMLDAGAVEADFAEVGSSNPATMRSVVVLPQPGGTQQREELAAREVQRNAVDGVVRGIVL